MRNRISVILIFIITLILLNYFNYTRLTLSYNEKMLSIISEIILKYDIDESEVSDILKSSTDIDLDILKDYGYYEDDLFFINDNVKMFNYLVFFNILVILFISIIYLVIEYLVYKKRRDELSKLILYLENINKGNYDLELSNNSEDILSKLRNEIYKTVVLLRENSEFLRRDKVVVKNNIVDISHQLKTPLTSISIMLESIINDKDMDSKLRDDFILEIDLNIKKINSLITSLLKLSKFDCDVVEFKKENILVSELIDNSISNVGVIAKNKGITFKRDVNDRSIICDKKWQVEALSNILKNCIEHSLDNGVIEIRCFYDNFSTTIVIKDFGCGMDIDSLNKLFNRFYKGESSTGIGVGLNLSKSIIEKDNGSIEVNSKKGSYSEFAIKYYK